MPIGGRYIIKELITSTGSVHRHRGLDLGTGKMEPIPVCIVQQAASFSDRQQSGIEDQSEQNQEDQRSADSEILRSDAVVATARASPSWPGLAWEKQILAHSFHLSLPRVIDNFEENGVEYLIEEVPAGRAFRHAWDENSVTWSIRCKWLIQIAEALTSLHNAGAIIGELCPENIAITPTDQAVISSVADLLPIPVPTTGLVRNSLYSAPELFSEHQAHASADLYCFGAMLQSLLIGSDLTALDFTSDGAPKSYAERNPDAHPLLVRLLAKTFTVDTRDRFPSDDLATNDPTGFLELLETLHACSRTLDKVHFDVAGWTSSGVIRSTNEDAVVVLQSSEVRLEQREDFAVVVLADGMGGMVSGELAAAMTTRSIRDFFLRQLAASNHDSSTAIPGTVTSIASRREEVIVESIKAANRTVFEASLKDENHRGMGCTVEVLVIDGSHVTIGHVGDGRCYHCRHEKLTQLTADQTFVGQLVLLGQLTKEEAITHPRRSELQQAVGCRMDVYPDVYSTSLEMGDQLLVCSDGLTNQLTEQDIIDVLQSASSAERAARRLINRTIVKGAIDNVSAVVVRAC